MRFKCIAVKCVRTITFSVALMISMIVSQFGCRSPENEHAVDSGDSAKSDSIMLEYYRTHGPVTDPGEYASLYDELPSDPAGLYEAVHGLLIHIFHAGRYGVTLSEERQREVQIRKVKDMSSRILELDDHPITHARNPQARLVGNCRDFAVLTCSLLRQKGIPSRARCGFGTYFTRGKYEDHWTCEYWSSDEERWIQIDPQLDSLQKELFHIDFDHLDMPAGKFLPAGEVWKGCRAGEIDPDLCGIFDLKGLWFVKDNLLRDLAALNKLELLPWDMNKLMEDSSEPSEAQYRLFDRIAELTTAGNSAFPEMRALYESNPQLQMSEPEGSGLQSSQ